MKKRVFLNIESFNAAVEVTNFSEKPLIACTPKWKIVDRKGNIIQSGIFKQTDIPLGNAFKLGTVSFSLNNVPAPAKLTLEVSVNSSSNSWNFRVYPIKRPTISGADKILVAQSMDEATRQFLENGGTVLLNLKKGSLSIKAGGDIAIGFSSIFRNTAWTHAQAPHTLGILCNPKHAALSDFPTKYHSNWQ